MTCHHSNANFSTLSASEWRLILVALEAYQHHTTYRDLYGKAVLLAKAAGQEVRPNR